MRILIINLLATAALLFGATAASAIAINAVPRTPLTSYTTSDFFILDVFLDATEAGLQLLSVGVLYPDDGTIVYDGAASAGLAPVAGGTSGAQPSYILYSPPSGMAAGMMPATILYPVVSPAFNNWGGALVPGTQQVNIDYAEAGFNPASATGLGIYIATLAFHIGPGFAAAQIELCVSCGGNIVRINDVELDPGTVGLSAPIIITGHAVPEPTTAMLIGFGVLGLAVAGRRRA